jgi:two-component system CheB/CheR fusion protein
MAEKKTRSAAGEQTDTRKKPAGKAEEKKKKPAGPKGRGGFHIVGIGASAGGLDAFERFFQNMPDDSGMGFILVPHLDPTHVSLMPELIQRSSKMQVIQVTDGTEVKPDSVYIVPPNHNLAILNRTLQLMQPARGSGPRMPIDYFFRSLAEDQREKAICVILSGMGTDGTLGLRTIKGELGMAVVQAPESAKYDSMPRSAIDTDLVDYVLPPEKMPEQLMAYAIHASKKIPLKVTSVDAKTPDALQKIFILLRSQTGHDFSGYKQNTILRRIERRMNVHQVDNISTYVRYLEETPLEVETLFKELLIGVTHFFRDEEAFEILEEKALPGMLKDKPNDHVIRAWVPGCSSGEEAYSIAIILRECTERLKRHYGIQIFATDIDSSAIDAARSGLYPASITTDVTSQRLKRFFAEEDNAYRVNKDIREMLIFAPQDIIKDPPFTKLDLICCRNLLIYLDSDLQKKLLPIFHYSLRSGGILFLGSSETVGGFTDLFTPIDKRWKIFRRRKGISALAGGVQFPVPSPMDGVYRAEEKKPAEVNLPQVAEKALLERYAPPSVIINNKGDILHIHGRTGRYLEPAPGAPKLNIYEMARKGLRLELPAAVRRAGIRNMEVVFKGLKVATNGDIQRVDLLVRPLNLPETVPGLMMVTFEDAPRPLEEASPKKKRAAGKERDLKIDELEKELQHTKESLQTTIEELETSNEELKSTNEELQSTNEELQSTNEELETSKEEQQSLNEELTTVNTELREKVEELTTANDDMKNLLDSIDIPTIFLDNELRIKRFTSHATRIFNLIQTDIGRPIGDIVSKIMDDVDIVGYAEAVLRDLALRGKEVLARDGAWYAMRIVPYRTIQNVIDGVVMTFKESVKKERRLATVIRDSNDAIMVHDFEGRILAWNRGAESMYGYSESEALKMNILEIVPEENRKEGLDMIRRIKAGKDVKSFKTRRMAKDGRIVEVWLTVTKLADEQGEPCEIATTERDLAWLSG